MFNSRPQISSMRASKCWWRISRVAPTHSPSSLPAAIWSTDRAASPLPSPMGHFGSPVTVLLVGMLTVASPVQLDRKACRVSPGRPDQPARRGLRVQRERLASRARLGQPDLKDRKALPESREPQGRRVQRARKGQPGRRELPGRLDLQAHKEYRASPELQERRDRPGRRVSPAQQVLPGRIVLAPTAVAF